MSRLFGYQHQIAAAVVVFFFGGLRFFVLIGLVVSGTVGYSSNGESIKFSGGRQPSLPLLLFSYFLRKLTLVGFLGKHLFIAHSSLHMAI